MTDKDKIYYEVYKEVYEMLKRINSYFSGMEDAILTELKTENNPIRYLELKAELSLLREFTNCDSKFKECLYDAENNYYHYKEVCEDEH